ncbi:MAG: hypothetical protein AMR96_01860 [Candidatus Adiutrix intracellularis]|jgi:hypothetical protein|nr:MAG: hypothetical protein AMR96_01860 [Candidatus Adiutrix intracellularis]
MGSSSRKDKNIAIEAIFVNIYIIKLLIALGKMNTKDYIFNYKKLSPAERTFHIIKNITEK